MKLNYFNMLCKNIYTNCHSRHFAKGSAFFIKILNGVRSGGSRPVICFAKLIMLK